jgi:hypothetical protein
MDKVMLGVSIPLMGGTVLAQVRLDANVSTVAPKEDLGQSLLVYPNPTEGSITIRFNAPYEMDAYTLSDLRGQTLRTALYKQPIQETTLNISELPKGIYLLHIRSGGQVLSQKVVVK